MLKKFGKALIYWPEKSRNSVSTACWEILDRAQIRILIGIIKIRLRNTLAAGLVVICVVKFISFCICPEILEEIEVQDSGLSNLMKEISRQPSVQTEAWILLALFS